MSYGSSMNITRLGGIAAAALISAALLAGCGSSSEPAASTAETTAASTAASTETTASTASTTSTATTEKVGGMAACDSESLTEAAKAADSTVMSVNGFDCADGWAYAEVSVGTEKEGYDAVMVFEAEGQFWIGKDRAKVCIKPGDQVPASIYHNACEVS